MARSLSDSAEPSVPGNSSKSIPISLSRVLIFSRRSVLLSRLMTKTGGYFLQELPLGCDMEFISVRLEIDGIKIRSHSFNSKILIWVKGMSQSSSRSCQFIHFLQYKSSFTASLSRSSRIVHSRPFAQAVLAEGARRALMPANQSVKMFPQGERSLPPFNPGFDLL